MLTVLITVFSVLFHLLLVKILWAALWKQFTNHCVRINDQVWSSAFYYCCFYSDMIWSLFTFSAPVFFCANLETWLAIQLTIRHRVIFLLIQLFLSTWNRPTRDSGVLRKSCTVALIAEFLMVPGIDA